MSVRVRACCPDQEKERIGVVWFSCPCTEDSLDVLIFIQMDTANGCVRPSPSLLTFFVCKPSSDTSPLVHWWLTELHDIRAHSSSCSLACVGKIHYPFHNPILVHIQIRRCARTSALFFQYKFVFMFSVLWSYPIFRGLSSASTLEAEPPNWLTFIVYLCRDCDPGREFWVTVLTIMWSKSDVHL